MPVEPAFHTGGWTLDRRLGGPAVQPPTSTAGLPAVLGTAGVWGRVEQRANYERELTRELRDAPLSERNHPRTRTLPL